MKSSIKCSMIRDIMPLYIEGLTSEETNIDIKEHLDECLECKDLELSMRADIEEETIEIEKEKQNINWFGRMAKLQKKNLRKVIVISACLVMLIIVAVIAKTYIIGSKMTRHVISNTDLLVSDNYLEIGAELKDKAYGIIDFEVTEKKGVVQVNVIGAKKSKFTKKSVLKKLKFKNNVKKVIIADLVLWEDQYTIREEVGELYCERIESLDKNSQIKKVLKLVDKATYCKVKPTLNKVDKDSKTVVLEIESIPDKSIEDAEEIFREFTFYLLAAIKELENVQWKYTLEGDELEYSVSLSDVEALLGVGDFKEYVESIINLECLTLSEKTMRYEDAYNKYGLKDFNVDNVFSDEFPLKNLKVSGNELVLKTQFEDPERGIKEQNITEENGIVRIDLVGRYRTDEEKKEKTYGEIFIQEKFANKITKIYFCDEIIYDNGYKIDSLITSAYDRKVDSILADKEATEWLVYGVAEDFMFAYLVESMDIEEKTITLNVEEGEEADLEALIKPSIRYSSYMLLACAKDLEKVVWKYNRAGKDVEEVYTVEEANTYLKTLPADNPMAGKNIKHGALNAYYLESLYRLLD